MADAANAAGSGRLVERPPAPAFSQALGFWLRLGCLSFGGPAGPPFQSPRSRIENSEADAAW